MSQKSCSVIPAPSQQKVLLLVDGKLVAELPVGVARRISKLLMGAAKVVENEENPLALIQSQKDLINMGIPIAMSDNPLIQKVVNKELRHEGLEKGAMSCGYKGVVASPSLTQHDPK